MTAPVKEAEQTAPRPEPSVRPPASRAVARLLKAACYPLIAGVCGGALLFAAHMAKPSARLGGWITVVVLCLVLAAILAAAAAVIATRQARLNPAPPVAALAGVAGVALAAMLRDPWLRIPVLAATAWALWRVTRWGIRWHRRRKAFDRWAQAIATEIAQNQREQEQVLAGLTKVAKQERITAPHYGAAPNAAWDLRPVAWDGAALHQARLICPTQKDIGNPEFLMGLRRAMKERVGIAFVGLEVDKLHDVITITALAGEAETRQAGQQEAAVERAKTAAGHILKDVRIKVLDWTADGMPDGAPPAWPLRQFEIRYEQTPKVTNANSRELIRKHMSLQLYNDESALRPEWSLGDDFVIFTRRNEFPAIIEHEPVDVRAEFGRVEVIAHATDEDGNLVGWQVSHTDAPHELVSGPTGTGKSVDNRTVAMQSAFQGYDTRLIDPKRIEFRGLRGWPNITQIATRVPRMIQVIDDTFDDMMNRYDLIETGQKEASDFRRIVLIIDEYLMLNMLVNDYWAGVRDKSDPKEHPVFRKVTALLVLARGANINIRIATQRVDATLFSDNQLGGVRDNLAGRVALGRQTQQSAQMMFGDAEVGRNIPIGAVATGYTLGPHGLALAKMHWLPDPARWNNQDEPLTDHERELILAMVPPGTTWNGPEPYRPEADLPPEAPQPKENPVTRLLWFAREALRCREAYLTDGSTGGAPADGEAAAFYGWATGPDGQPHHSGTWIGCAASTPAGRRVYLHPERALQVITQVAGGLDVPFTWARQELDEALHKSGLLITETSDGKERYTVRRQLPGNDVAGANRQRVWDLPEDEVIGDLPDGASPAPSSRPAPGSGTLKPREKQVRDLVEGDRIVVYIEGDDTPGIEAYFEFFGNLHGGSGPAAGSGLVVINYRGIAGGLPGTVLAAPGDKIRLADPPAGPAPEQEETT